MKMHFQTSQVVGRDDLIETDTQWCISPEVVATVISTLQLDEAPVFVVSILLLYLE